LKSSRKRLEGRYEEGGRGKAREGGERRRNGGSGVGVRLKVGEGINIEKIEGVGSGEGLCRPQLGVWGLSPRKKSILR